MTGNNPQRKVPSPVRSYCCETMEWQVAQTCDMHPDPFDCADNLVYHDARRDRYGLIIHDGGASFVIIKFCPWCGQRLNATEQSSGRRCINVYRGELV